MPSRSGDIGRAIGWKRRRTEPPARGSINGSPDGPPLRRRGLRCSGLVRHAHLVSDREPVIGDAADAVRRALGIEPIPAALIARLLGQIGQTHVEVALAVARQVPTDRRRYSLAALAAASLTMDTLGARWWTTPTRRSGVTLSADDRSPSQLLSGGGSWGSPERPVTELVGAWAKDDLADHLWGTPVAFIDEHMSQRNIDKVQLPDGLAPGDDVVLAWDAGCRVRAVVERHSPGRLTVRPYGDLLYSPAEDVWLNWATATEADPPWEADQP